MQQRLQQRATWTEADSAWLSAYVASPDYEGLQSYFASRGLEWAPPDDSSTFNQAG